MLLLKANFESCWPKAKPAHLGYKYSSVCIKWSSVSDMKFLPLSVAIFESIRFGDSFNEDEVIGT